MWVRPPSWGRNSALRLQGKEKDVRVCVSCRQTRPKRELIRVARHFESGEVRVFPEPLTDEVSRKYHGRSAYVCSDSPDCVQQAHKKNRVGRSLRAPVAAEIYTQLAQLVQPPEAPPEPQPDAPGGRPSSVGEPDSTAGALPVSLGRHATDSTSSHSLKY
ncbi:hypothetical protein CDCA_CDCA10G2987 [Cyanidium caldarium]|uniref:YlxR domain-containing protein n=1 Tax=Cyanidium caldarium TaxID=2771 RepID=A0AAV9IXF7_CYACA|nr:hypothetical protein CDCA_CDCA10G2987 [Cyanidium caldarium]